MDNSTYYSWDETTKKLLGEQHAQIDPLESEKAGYPVYCGIPVNATYTCPPAEKDGFDIIMGDNGWEYKEIEKEEAYEPTELDKAYQTYYNAVRALAATDYRALKYIDGEYTEEQYAVYRAERAELRQAVRDAEETIKELEQ